jgi:thioredoxin reductase
MTTDAIDVIVIGAGPAGMAAATTAAKGGAKVLVLDDQRTFGGQIYRNVALAGTAEAAFLGDDYMAGQSVIREFCRQDLEFRAKATVWQVTEERQVGYSMDGSARMTTAPWLVLASGALERPCPVPGWTLPGVMMAGAAQTLLKSSGLAAEGAVFAGSGPLLYLVAHQYLKAGVKIAALVDITPKSNRVGALPHLLQALRRWDLLAKGRRWISEIANSGTPIITGVEEIKVLGDDAAMGLAFRKGVGEWHEISSPHVFLHLGVSPNVNLSLSAGLAHNWDEGQLCWRPKVDEWGVSSLPGIAVAGDSAGIGGGLAAQAGGEIAALGILAALGLIDAGARDTLAREARKTLAREQAIRPFLDSWFRPGAELRLPRDDDTIVCRCEELTLGDIRAVVDIGLVGPNQLKSFSRAGMGPCQGRFCGLTVQELIARQTGQKPADVGYFRLRPPIKPLLLEELAVGWLGGGGGMEGSIRFTDASGKCGTQRSSSGPMTCT